MLARDFPPVDTFTAEPRFANIIRKREVTLRQNRQTPRA
jgi:hypothetical protein